MPLSEDLRVCGEAIHLSRSSMVMATVPDEMEEGEKEVAYSFLLDSGTDVILYRLLLMLLFIGRI